MIYLISCVSQKGTIPQPAKDLYRSDWFRKARAYVESTGARWFILSAKHHLVQPETVLAPYDECLSDYPASTRHVWARQTAPRITAACIASNAREITILAGKTYSEFLIPELEIRGYTVKAPLAHMGIGQQKRWFIERLLFTCHKCGGQCAVAPDQPAKAVCEDCCEDHDYQYTQGERCWNCVHCFKQRPEDW